LASANVFQENAPPGIEEDSPLTVKQLCAEVDRKSCRALNQMYSYTFPNQRKSTLRSMRKTKFSASACACPQFKKPCLPQSINIKSASDFHESRITKKTARLKRF
jgi:hypothetical protein